MRICIELKASILLCAAAAVLFGCGNDDSSTSAPIPHMGRCLEEYKISEDAAWSSDLSDSSFVKQIICEHTKSFLGNTSHDLKCLGIDYNSSKKRYDITLQDDGNLKHVYTVFKGCSFKLGTEADFQSSISDMGTWSLDDCLCKEKDGSIYYREADHALDGDVDDPVKQSSSSIKPLEDSSSSNSVEKKSSSSSKTAAKEVTTEYLNQDMFAKGKYGDLLDTRDNQLYRTIKIGTQNWMAQDLNYIPEENEIDGVFKSRCNLDNPDNCEIYGRLYTWAAAMNLSLIYNDEDASSLITAPHRGICPKGWHIPSNADFETLRNYVVTTTGDNEDLATYLRSTKLWSESEAGTDDFGFSIIPMGSHIGYFQLKGYQADFWAATESESDETIAYHWYISRDHESFEHDVTSYGTKDYYYAVRCVEND